MRINEAPRAQPSASVEPTPSETTAQPATPAAANVVADGFGATGALAAPVAIGAEGPGGRSTEQALAEADTLLRGEVSETTSGSNGATIVRDAADSNEGTDTDPSSLRFQTATTQLGANAALEQQHLARLSPEDRQRYEQTRGALTGANDPVSQVALQQLLFTGKLPGQKDLTGAATTLEHLSRLSDPTTPLASGIDRGQLVADLTQELATPTSINQRAKNTCAPTTVSLQLAMNNPAEYARLVGGLASPEGKVKLAGGATISREGGTQTDDGSGRSVTQRLLTPALMEHADGKLLNYDNEKDKHTALGIGLFPGAPAVQIDRLLEGVYGRDFGHRTLLVGGQVENIKAQLAQGETVPVTLKFGNEMMSWHKVLVTGVETVDGKEFVRYANPWGREERMPLEEFQGRLKEVNWDPGQNPTPRTSAPNLVSPYRYGGGTA